MNARFEHHQLKRKLCRDAAEILRSGATNEQDILYRVWKRQNYCQAPNSVNVFIAVDDDSGRVVRRLLKYCGKRSCPWCIESLVARQRGRVEEVCRRWRERGGSWLFVTLTIPHDRLGLAGDDAMEKAKDHFRECDSLLEAVWRRFSQYYRSTLDIGWVSHCRKSEATFGGPADGAAPPLVSYHTHLHLLVAVDRDYKLGRLADESYRAYTRRQAEANLVISQRLYEAWSNALAAVLKKNAKRFPSIAARQASGKIVLREPFIEEVTKRYRDKKGRRRRQRVYVCKGATTAEAPFGGDTSAVERYLAAEVTYSHRKRGKGFATYSWLEGLEHFANDDWFRLLYRHWVRRLYRSSTFEWGIVSAEACDGTKRRMSFERFLRGGPPSTKASPIDTTVVGSFTSREYRKLATQEALYAALDELATTGSEASLLRLGLKTDSLVADQLANENQRRLVREAAGYIKHGMIEHATVAKVASPVMMELICLIRSLTAKLEPKESNPADDLDASEVQANIQRLYGELKIETEAWLRESGLRSSPRRIVVPVEDMGTL